MLKFFNARTLRTAGALQKFTRSLAHEVDTRFQKIWGSESDVFQTWPELWPNEKNILTPHLLRSLTQLDRNSLLMMQHTNMGRIALLKEQITVQEILEIPVEKRMALKVIFRERDNSHWMAKEAEETNDRYFASGLLNIKEWVSRPDQERSAYLSLLSVGLNKRIIDHCVLAESWLLRNQFYHSWFNMMDFDRMSILCSKEDICTYHRKPRLLPVEQVREQIIDKLMNAYDKSYHIDFYEIIAMLKKNCEIYDKRYATEHSCGQEKVMETWYKINHPDESKEDVVKTVDDHYHNIQNKGPGF